MSIKLLSQTWELETSGNERAILQVLCDYANDDGVCWPSIATVAWKVGCAEQTVRNIFQTLYEKGALAKIEDGGGRAKTNTYRVNLDALDRKPPRPGNPQNPPTVIGGIGGFDGNPQNPPISPETPQQLLGGNRQIEPSEEKQRERSRAGRTLPVDFILTPERLAFAVAQGMPERLARLAFQRFTNYWLGEGKTKKDWDATWRNWVLSDMARLAEKGGGAESAPDYRTDPKAYMAYRAEKARRSIV